MSLSNSLDMVSLFPIDTDLCVSLTCLLPTGLGRWSGLRGRGSNFYGWLLRLLHLSHDDEHPRPNQHAPEPDDRDRFHDC